MTTTDYNDYLREAGTSLVLGPPQFLSCNKKNRRPGQCYGVNNYNQIDVVLWNVVTIRRHDGLLLIVVHAMRKIIEMKQGELGQSSTGLTMTQGFMEIYEGYLEI